SMPFQYGYPGNRTPYNRTRLLMPHTYLAFVTASVHRFWPTHAPKERTVEGVARFSLVAGAYAMRKAARFDTVNLVLNSGLDIRTVFATVLHSGIPFRAYTYGRSGDTAIDRAFAHDLAAQHSVHHEVVPTIAASKALRAHLDEAHYRGMHRPVIQSLMTWFGNPVSLAVSANLLEIGRSFYLGARRSKCAAPVT